MKVKDILEIIKDLDPELEVTTAISQDCFSDEFSLTYGIDPRFSKETLYEYNEHIYTEEEDIIEELAESIEYDEIHRILENVPRSEKLVIFVSP